MTSWQDIKRIFARWIDCIATLLIGFLERLVARRFVRLVEQEPGRLVVDRDADMPDGGELILDLAETDGPARMQRGSISSLRGCRAELRLAPDRILFRPLELPARATEFIYGIVRSQIDRLTPWRPDDAVFGWSEPIEVGPNRIVVTVAAAARSSVAPYLQAFTTLGARHLTVSTVPSGPETAATPIVLMEQSISSLLDFHRVRRAVLIFLVAVVAGGVLTTAGSSLFAGVLQSRHDESAQRIAELRARARKTGDASVDVGTEGLRALESRKRETPSSVLVLESLSRSLPDHTYVTELRIEGKRVQVIGVTRDAASLIKLIEESSHFTQATFFAPTTRIVSPAGERFHIEAQIDPAYRPR
jgi:general secretion pathway protein L